MALPPTTTERPSITSEELDQFFTDRNVKGECPSCGTNHWIPMTPMEGSHLGGVGLVTVDHLSKTDMSSYVPTVALTCENCGYPRMFVWAVLEAWKKARGSKP